MEMKFVVLCVFIDCIVGNGIAPNEGIPGCPCSSKHHSALVTSNYTRDGKLLVAPPGGVYERPLDYGSYCHAWDAGYAPGCASHPVAPYCTKPWCYVDMDNCTVTNKAAVWILGLGLRFSYEACGVEHTLEGLRGDLEEGLKGKKLRWAFPADLKPWHFKLHDGQWDGIMWQWFVKLKHEAGFELEEHNVSKSSLDKYPNKWDACAHDIQRGLLDVCPTMAWQTTFRAQQTAFAAPVIWAEFRLLVAKPKEEEEGINFVAPFEPFHGELYLGFLGIILCTAFSFYALEGDPDSPSDEDHALIVKQATGIAAEIATPDQHPSHGDATGLGEPMPSTEQPESSLVKRSADVSSSNTSEEMRTSSQGMAGRASDMGHHMAVDIKEFAVNILPEDERQHLKGKSFTKRFGEGLGNHLYNSTMSFFGDKNLPARTIPGRFLKVAFTFFILVTMSSYTANLAAFLVKSERSYTGIRSLEDCCNQDLKVCVTQSIEEAIPQISPCLTQEQVIYFPNSITARRGLTYGHCSAALVPSHDYETRPDFQACNETLVGDSVMGMGIATLADPDIVASYSYYTILLHQRGLFEEIHNKYKSRKLKGCPQPSDTWEDDNRLGHKHFLGLLLLYSSAVGISWIIRLAGSLKSRYFQTKVVMKQKTATQRDEASPELKKSRYEEAEPSTQGQVLPPLSSCTERNDLEGSPTKLILI